MVIIHLSLIRFNKNLNGINTKIITELMLKYKMSKYDKSMLTEGQLVVP